MVNDPGPVPRLFGSAACSANQPTPNPLTIPAGTGPYALTGRGGWYGSGTGAGDFHTALNSDGTGTGGVHLLDTVPIFNLLCVPGETNSTVIRNLQGYCHSERAFYIVDSASDDNFTSVQGKLSGITGVNAINSAFYFPG